MAFEQLAADGYQALINGLVCTREEFSIFYLQAQQELEAADRVEFDILTAAAQDEQEAYVLAMRQAKTSGWFDLLIDILIVENGLSETYLQQAAVHLLGGSAILQALSDPARGFGLPELSIKGMIDGIRWTGQVVINNIATGSGVLIGPHLFLTAWHVVQSLFNNTADGYVPDLLKYNRLVVNFDNRDTFSADGRRQQAPTITQVPAAPNWCVAFAPCHELEEAHQNPENLEELRGLWDYAIIRLSVPVGLKRRYARPDSRSVVPRSEDPLVIFQYPKMAPLRYDQQKVVAAQENQRAFIPQLRFLHNANTTDGSSGGPCFDRSFNCFGIHQGSWNQDGVNKGIPLVAILQDIKSRYNELPALSPEEYPLWTFDESLPEPIIGCESFQAQVWQSVAGKPKIMLIQGADGFGKTFRIRVLQRMLVEGAHLKLELRGETTSKMDATTFLHHIAKKLGLQEPTIIPFSEEHSTSALWLRYELLVHLTRLLEEKRDGRLVWLIFTDLNQHQLEGPYLQEFFYLICDLVKSQDWLRVIIDGGSPQLPLELAPLSQIHAVNAITEDQLRTFFNYYTAYLGGGNYDQIVNWSLHDLVRSYDSNMRAAPAEALTSLIRTVYDTMDRLSKL